MKKILVVWLLILTALVATLFAQATGTPNTLRVITDASGYLVASIQAQTLPLSQPTIFSNTRLRTDASGYLLVAAATGGGYPALSGNAWEVLRGDGVFSATLPRGTITTSSPWTLTQTWNAVGTTFVGLDINNTVTAAAEGSAYLKIENASGDVFSIVKDDALATGSIAVSVNASKSGGSGNFALRSNGGGVFLTAGPASTTTRQFYASTISLGNTTVGADARLWRTTGLNLGATLPACWTATNADASCDSGFNRDAAGVIAVTSGTASTYRDLRSRHLLGAGTAPAVTNTSANSCGTTAATLVGSDTAGKVTVGATSGTSCTITFTAAFTNAPACSVSDETTAVLARATSTTTTVILAGVFTAADVLSYNCISY